MAITSFLFVIRNLHLYVLLGLIMGVAHGANSRSHANFLCSQILAASGSFLHPSEAAFRAGQLRSQAGVTAALAAIPTTLQVSNSSSVEQKAWMSRRLAILDVAFSERRAGLAWEIQGEGLANYTRSVREILNHPEWEESESSLSGFLTQIDDCLTSSRLGWLFGSQDLTWTRSEITEKKLILLVESYTQRSSQLYDRDPAPVFDFVDAILINLSQAEHVGVSFDSFLDRKARRLTIWLSLQPSTR